jgi:hypothetical protein
MSNRKPFEWGRALVPFVFGAGLGTLLGIGVQSLIGSWITIPGIALLSGLIAVVFEDSASERLGGPHTRV